MSQNFANMMIHNVKAKLVPLPCEQRELSSFQFNGKDILKIIRALHVSKAHGCDDISICMIKICDQSIIKPLPIIYQNCLNTGTFPDIWKKSNIVPVHKKGDKQVVNNYRPAS